MRYLRIIWHTALFLLDRFFVWLSAKARSIWQELDLFVGLTLLVVGMLHIHIGRFCDGNSADYLSCTRPAVFYYYSGLEIAMVVLGVALIATWMLSSARR